MAVGSSETLNLSRIQWKGRHYLEALQALGEAFLEVPGIFGVSFSFYRNGVLHRAAGMGEEGGLPVLQVPLFRKDGEEGGYFQLFASEPLSAKVEEAFREAGEQISRELFLEEWEYDFSFLQNRACAYFPCHPLGDLELESFNCLFCYCPLYLIPECGGDYSILPNGVKDCSACLVPHRRENYSLINDILTRQV